MSNLFEAAVLYAVVWFMTCFVTLPFLLRTQAESGEVVPGTHEGAPADFSARRMIWRVTLIATPVFLLITAIILFSGITVADLDYFDRMARSYSGN
jgi:predicted secreted protein